MSLSEKAFDAISQFPAWLETFDALQIPAWTVLLAMSAAAIGLIFAVREFLSWFLKTSAIVDEVIRLETMVRDLQGDLAALETIVERLQVTAGVSVSQAALATSAEEPAKRQFRLDI